MKKRLNTFEIKESFSDPYTGEFYQAGMKVEESDLKKRGWSKADIDSARFNLLVPILWPDPTTEESNDGKDNSS